MTIYADTSFFVSIYLQDTHSAKALAFAKYHPRLWLTPLHIAECCHAFTQQVFFGKITSPMAEKLCDQLHRDRAANLWLETTIPEYAFDRCAEIARRHGPKLALHTLDSLHVACALELKVDRFWTFDERQAKLEKAEKGLKTH